MNEHTTTQFDYKKYLRKYLLLIYQRKALFASIFLLTMAGAIVTSYLLPKKYEARSVVFIEQSVIAELVRGIAMTPSVQAQIRVLTTSMMSRPMLMQVIQELDLDLNRSDEEMEMLLNQLRGSTRINLRERDGLFTVSFTDQNPRIARDYVNTLVRRYIEDNLSSKRDESLDATSFLSEQIDIYRQRLDQVESEIRGLRREKGHVLDHTEGDIRLEIAAIDNKLEEMRIRRSQLEAQASMTTSMDSLFEFDTLDPVDGRLAALESQLDDLLIRYAEEHPEVRKVRSEIARLEERVQNQSLSDPDPLYADTMSLESPAMPDQGGSMFDIQLSGLQASEQRLLRQKSELQQLLNDIPQVQAELEVLLRDRDEQQRIYDQLMVRLGQSELSKQMEIQDKAATFRIIESAVLPVIPSSPNRPMIMVAGMFFGVAVAFGLIFLLDFMDHSVRDVDLLKRLGFPVLAVIPKKENKEALVRQRRKTMLFFLVTGLCFTFLLSFLAMEVLGINVVDEMVENLQIRPVVDDSILKLKEIYWSLR